jgi:hypothetical protein
VVLVGVVRSGRGDYAWYGSDVVGGYWWRLMRIDLYGVKAAMLYEILANNKKSVSRSNSFSWIFIFWSFTQDFEFSEFFSEAPYLPQSHGNLPCSHEPLQPSIGSGITNL